VRRHSPQAKSPRNAQEHPKEHDADHHLDRVGMFAVPSMRR
jgi:hypothetical protein